MGQYGFVPLGRHLVFAINCRQSSSDWRRRCPLVACGDFNVHVDTTDDLYAAVDRRWKRNVVYAVTSLMVVMRLPISYVSSMAMLCYVPVVNGQKIVIIIGPLLLFFVVKIEKKL